MNSIPTKTRKFRNPSLLSLKIKKFLKYRLLNKMVNLKFNKKSKIWKIWFQIIWVKIKVQALLEFKIKTFCLKKIWSRGNKMIYTSNNSYKLPRLLKLRLPRLLHRHQLLLSSSSSSYSTSHKQGLCKRKILQRRLQRQLFCSKNSNSSNSRN